MVEDVVSHITVVKLQDFLLFMSEVFLVEHEKAQRLSKFLKNPDKIVLLKHAFLFLSTKLLLFSNLCHLSLSF